VGRVGPDEAVIMIPEGLLLQLVNRRTPRDPPISV
jgi:hypothetical protein